MLTKLPLTFVTLISNVTVGPGIVKLCEYNTQRVYLGLFFDGTGPFNIGIMQDDAFVDYDLAPSDDARWEFWLEKHKTLQTLEWYYSAVTFNADLKLTEVIYRGS